MVWYHYSKDSDLSLDKLIDLPSDNHSSYPFKPSGLWLSLNDEWYDFQTDMDDKKFVEKLKYKYEVKFDLEKRKRILIINTLEKLQAFDEKYKIDMDNKSKEDYNGNLEAVNKILPGRFPDWEKVCEDYDGMVCTNYTDILISGKLIEKMHWWSWLDINSACIWRPTKVVKEILI